MSVFIGVIDFNSAAVDRRLTERLARAIAGQRPGPSALRHLGAATFGQATSPSTGLQPLVGAAGCSLFMGVSILDNREDMGAALGLDSAQLAVTTDAAIVLQAFERWGDAGVAKLLGAFAFAHWDENAKCLTLGRDCLGRASLFYHFGAGQVAFATTLNGLLALPSVPREIDETALAHFLALNMPAGARTFYRGIARVPSRSVVTIEAAGVRQRRYWAPAFDAPPPFKREDDYVERARELFDQAVAASLRTVPDAAVSLSGGLDSSAVAATAARLGIGRSISCYTVVPPTDATFELPPQRYRSEREKVEALGCLYPALELHFVTTTDDEPGAFDDMRWFARYGAPTRGPANRAWFDKLLRAVPAAGHRGILVGRSGNFGLSWQGAFSLTSLLQSGRLGEFTKQLVATARQSNRSVANTMIHDVALRALPRAAQRLVHRIRGRDPYDVSWFSALNPHYVTDAGLVAEWRAEGYDPWMVQHAGSAARYRAEILFDRHQQGRDVGLPVAADDMMMLDPHGDRRVLEFALAVPEPLYRKNGVPRAFARRVFADRLPPEILLERRRGAQAVTWFRALDARRSEIADDIERLEASPLASRLIDVARLKDLLAHWPEDEYAAECRRKDYKLALSRAVHVGRFIRWVEGGNA